MIPARMGSKRVKNKNLRLINGKPLIAYIIESATNANIFDDIYINSESEIFKSIAEHYNVKFYHRPQSLASDSATNDDFTLDFINHIDTDILIQLLPTSPFITSKDIQQFTRNMAEEKHETFISVRNDQIECIYNNQAINFVGLSQNVYFVNL